MDADQFAQIMSGITEVRTEQTNFRRELLGNGQPGRIQVIETDIENLKTEQNKIKTDAAVTVWKFGTMSATAGAALTIAAQWVGRKLFHF